MVVAGTAAVVAGVITFLVTRHPLLVYEAGLTTFVTLGGTAVGGAVGFGGTVAVEKITEEYPEKKKENPE